MPVRAQGAERDRGRSWGGYGRHCRMRPACVIVAMTGRANLVVRSAAALAFRSYLVRKLRVALEIIESRHRRLELQVDGAGRAMALLADDDLGLAVHRSHLQLPFRVLIGPGSWLLVAEIVFLAEYEHHDIGVLLDGARFAQVRELRSFVVAVLDLSR